MKLIAYNITNLTDARYFAARGAEMIGFSSMLSTPEEVNAIKDWVDVPGFFLRIPENASAEYIWEWQEKTGITIFLISALSEDVAALFPSAGWIIFLDGDQEGFDPGISHIFIPAEHTKTWQALEEQFSNPYNEAAAYIEFSADLKISPDQLSNITGVLIKGSGEDKVGVKSFDEIDDFLDGLEIEY